MTYQFNPREFYAALIENISVDDVKQVAKIMLSYVGEENAVTLKALAIRIFGEFTTNTERKTRLILEELVTKYRFPIGAYSGKSGRWLCKNKEEIDLVVADLESRRNATANRIRALNMAVVPAPIPTFDHPRQNNLWQ
jgi:hypothetical protein